MISGLFARLSRSPTFVHEKITSSEEGKKEKRKTSSEVVFSRIAKVTYELNVILRCSV
jgi:hypothetical protein